MAKKPTKISVNKELLGLVVAATQSGTIYYVSQTEADEAGLKHNPPLIEVNTAMLEGDKAAARATEAGIAFMAPAAPKAAVEASTGFELVKGAVLPPSKRGVGLHGGAPKKYPFDQMEVGDSFFVPVSDKLPNPVKTLGSTVSSVNLRYAEVSGEKTVTRAKRGPDRKAVFENGQKVMETVTVPVHKKTRVYEIRGVEAGKQYGTYTAPADGALIARSA